MIPTKCVEKNPRKLIPEKIINIPLTGFDRIIDVHK